MTALWVVAIVVSLVSIGVAIWSLCRLASVNRELDDRDRELAAMEASADRMMREMRQRDLEEVGQ